MFPLEAAQRQKGSKRCEIYFQFDHGVDHRADKVIVVCTVRMYRLMYQKITAFRKVKVYSMVYSMIKVYYMVFCWANIYVYNLFKLTGRGLLHQLWQNNKISEGSENVMTSTESFVNNETRGGIWVCEMTQNYICVSEQQ